MFNQWLWLSGSSAKQDFFVAVEQRGAKAGKHLIPQIP